VNKVCVDRTVECCACARRSPLPETRARSFAPRISLLTPTARDPKYRLELAEGRTETTPWSRALLGKLIATQLVKKFSSFCTTQRFITWVVIAQWYSAGRRARWSGFETRQGLRIFLYTTASRTTLGPTQPPNQWVPGAFSLGVKRSGREADHSPPSSAEVKNAWSYTSAPPIRPHGVVLS
jgi:hypothetical protein